MKTPARSRQSGPVAAIGYVRVSTGDQADSGAGLEAQRAVISGECLRRGWDLEFCEDAAASARRLSRRPALAKALVQLDSGAADALVVSKLDRLSRSLLDFAGLMSRAQSRGWNLVALDLGIDLGTPAGEFMANVMASAAQWERRIIGQRTKDALAVKRAQGVKLGRPPSIPPVVVTAISQRRDSGLSLRAIADELNAEAVATGHGGRRWYASTVRQVLRASHREPAERGET
ncbi:MAG TPA: recombinase family protein [Actinomycetota bacterium]|nr:recombinase family protein [Actinomycetota bacterium]